MKYPSNWDHEARHAFDKWRKGKKPPAVKKAFDRVQALGLLNSNARVGETEVEKATRK